MDFDIRSLLCKSVVMKSLYHNDFVKLLLLVIVIFIMQFFMSNVLHDVCMACMEYTVLFKKIVFSYLSKLNSILSSILFLEIFHVPLMVVWVLSISIVLSFTFKTAVFRFIIHGLGVLLGNVGCDAKAVLGDLTYYQVFSTALAGVLGVGTIAGVALAITAGGPGVIFWMLVIGFLMVATKFCEAILSHKYRTVDRNKKIIGGPFLYIVRSMDNRNMPKFAKILAGSYGFVLVVAMLSGSIMFQANQAIRRIVEDIGFLSDKHEYISVYFTLLLAFSVFRGVALIGRLNSVIVPVMVAVYISSIMTIIFIHRGNIMHSVDLIISSALNYKAVGGGTIGGTLLVSMVYGIRRVIYCTESGIGISSIIHASTRNNESVREGCIATLESISTILVASLTGFVVIVTGAYEMGYAGIASIKYAFASVNNWFSYILTIVIPLFSFSTIVSYSYYGEMGWMYLFNGRCIFLYRILLMLSVYLGCIMIEMESVLIDLADFLYIMLTIPNVIVLFILRKEILLDVRLYSKKFLIKNYETNNT